ncbi:HdeD family acid-resistance protein [Microbacterium sp. gxy059]|uniref:HdeD family acid-resistance protein n=1 Tax=Microbacterium sp. gxy059 TaxID=2957199 RepID=UPI003D975FE3
MSADTRPVYGLRQSLRTAILVSSIVSLLFGLAILIWPVKSAAAITILVAIYTLVGGLLNLVYGIASKGTGGWMRAGLIALGLLFIAAGVVAVADLGETTLLLAVFVTTLLGIAWIFEGVVSLFSLGGRDTAWEGSERGHKGWTVFFAIVSILAGIALILSPLLTALWLWIFVGATLVVFGIIGIFRAAALGK